MQLEDPRTDILHLLKRKESSVDELSPKLGISPTATRQHLSILERDGLVKRTPVKEKLGRPKAIYSLTERAEKFFPKAYAEFLKWIIKAILDQEGAEGVRALMGRLGTERASLYRARMRGVGDVESVVEVLKELGAFAELKSENGHREIREFNCLIYEVALEFGEMVCEFDVKFISGLLNTKVALKRCIAHGDKCCSFDVGVT